MDKVPRAVVISTSTGTLNNPTYPALLRLLYRHRDRFLFHRRRSSTQISAHPLHKSTAGKRIHIRVRSFDRFARSDVITFAAIRFR